MGEHFFVSNISLKKAHDGSWFVNKVFTSVGNFDLGPEVSRDIEKSKMEAIIDEIRSKIFSQVQGFLQEEVKEEEKSKNG